MKWTKGGALGFGALFLAGCAMVCPWRKHAGGEAGAMSVPGTIHLYLHEVSEAPESASTPTAAPAAERDYRLIDVRMGPPELAQTPEPAARSDGYLNDDPPARADSAKTPAPVAGLDGSPTDSWPKFQLPAETPASRPSLNFDYPDGRKLTVHVTWKESEADAAGILILARAEKTGQPILNLGITDKKGMVTLLLPRDAEACTVWNDNPAAQPWVGELKLNQTQSAEVSLLPCATVYGRAFVEDEDHPAAGAKVMNSVGLYGQNCAAGETGYYEIHRLPTDTPVKLSAKLGSYGFLDSKGLTLKGGETHGPFDIILKKNAPTTGG